MGIAIENNKKLEALKQEFKDALIENVKECVVVDDVDISNSEVDFYIDESCMAFYRIGEQIDKLVENVIKQIKL